MLEISRRMFVQGLLCSCASAVVACGLVGCGSKGAAVGASVASTGAVGTGAVGTGAMGTTKLTVFAAASLTEALTAIGDAFKKQNAGVDLAFNFDSSGTLATQIQEGAACDVFISAGQKQMNALDASAKADSGAEALIDHATRLDLLENKVALAVPEGNPKQVTNFATMANKLAAHELLLALGNADVPVGQYAQKILSYYKLDEKDLAAAGCLTYGTNVKEVATQVAEGAVDCGVIYKTDAVTAGLTCVDEAGEDMCGRVVYPAAVVSATEHKELAQEFLTFCASATAAAEFERIGFTPLQAS